MNESAEIAMDAEILRREFDSAFALPEVARAENFADLIAIRSDAGGYAVRLAEISALVNGHKIVPLPGTVRGFIGLIGYRSKLLPVYSLSAFLGSAPNSSPSWFVIDRSPEPVALTFDGYEGYLRVEGGQIIPAQEGGGENGIIFEAVKTERETRPIISIPALVNTIRTNFHQNPRSKE